MMCLLLALNLLTTTNPCLLLQLLDSTLMHLSRITTTRLQTSMTQQLKRSLQILLCALGTARQRDNQSLPSDTRNGSAHDCKRRHLQTTRQHAVHEARRLLFDQRPHGLGSHILDRETSASRRDDQIDAFIASFENGELDCGNGIGDNGCG